jgi:hypothetical protein
MHSMRVKTQDCGETGSTEPWRLVVRELCTRLLTVLPLEIREMIYRYLLPEVTKSCVYSRDSVSLRWLRYGPQLTGDPSYWVASPWAEQEQILDELARIYICHTEFHFHGEDLHRVPHFLTKQLWWSTIAPAEFLQHIELFASCSYTTVHWPYRATSNRITISRAQKILRSICQV